MKKRDLVILILFSCLSIGCIARTPGVIKGDPVQSFFKEQVTYPFTVNYARAQAGDGTTWEIGYMDVAPVSGETSHTLVLIHGRAFNGAYFGHATRFASQYGIRIIVPDLPNYGKSIPGNLDKPLVRSLQHTREVIHDLVVNRLGISKAFYGGHSLGGQFALGYALTYPEAVQGLILIAPAGLEELPARHFPEILSRSTDKEVFKALPYYTRKAGLDFSTDPGLIEDFYFYRLKIKGKRIPAGMFKTENPDSRLSTDIRKGMIEGNPTEFYRYSITSLRDVYTLGVEIQQEDPDSLFKRYDMIHTPILLIFGDEEPFYPKKISGLKDLKKDMIRPFYQRMTAAGCPVSVKLYPGCGHFPHNDRPGLFGNDLVTFITGQKVRDTVDPGSL